MSKFNVGNIVRYLGEIFIVSEDDGLRTNLISGMHSNAIRIASIPLERKINGCECVCNEFDCYGVRCDCCNCVIEYENYGGRSEIEFIAPTLRDYIIVCVLGKEFV